MKKLIIIAAVALFGAVAQAATVNWSVNAIQGPSGTSAAAGWLVQVYASSVAFSYDAAKAGTITTWDAATSVAAGTTFRAADSGTQDNGTTASYYAVVYDAGTVSGAKNYIVSTDVSVTVADSGATANLMFGSMAGTSLAANTFYGQSWTSTAVPEPTSGLLMLLGVAGLALRRRRA